jgi:uncharacterized membrane protein (UPF0127 family)
VDNRRVVVAVSILVVLAGVGYVVAGTFLTSASDYDRTTVTINDADGSELATVEVRVADTYRKRVTGLSNTASLDDGEGMLFVHDRAGVQAYVMRDMAFPIDILFVAPNGTITTIHHAELPPPDTPNSELTRYRGYGSYVLEVPYGFTNRTGVEVGDRLVVDDRDDS